MIRLAKKGDILEVVSILVQAWGESENYSRLDYDLNKVSIFVTNLVVSPAGLLIVMEDNGRIVGALGAMIQDSWWYRGKMANGIFWYVLPSHRGKGIGMLEYFLKQVSGYPAVKQIVVGTTFGGDKGGNVYIRKGFHRLGSTWSMET